jgi:hypothetical protein
MKISVLTTPSKSSMNINKKWKRFSISLFDLAW